MGVLFRCFACGQGTRFMLRATFDCDRMRFRRTTMLLKQDAGWVCVCVGGGSNTRAAYILARWHVGAAACRPDGRPVRAASYRVQDSASVSSEDAYFHPASWPQLQRNAAHAGASFRSGGSASLANDRSAEQLLSRVSKEQTGCTGADFFFFFKGDFFFVCLFVGHNTDSVKENRTDDKKREKCSKCLNTFFFSPPGINYMQSVSTIDKKPFGCTA